MLNGKPTDTPSTNPEPNDDQAIPFAAGADNAQPVLQPEAAEARKPAGAAARSEDGEDALEIKWFDEDQPLEAGHLFAAPAPEPPLQPFEIVHEPKGEAHAAASGVAGGPAQVTPGQGYPGRGAEGPHRSGPVSGKPHPVRPPFWERLLWGFMPIILLLTGYGAVILTQQGIGFAWDEAYYYEPSLKAADWLTEVIRGHKPFGREAIDAAWAGPNGEFGHGYQEHPSVMKFLCGLALRSFPDQKLQLWAMRLPIAILFGLTLSLIYLLGRRVWGPVPGLLAALIYAFMPRIFGHAHFASLETPLVFMMMLTVFCFLRGLDYPFWAAMTGISFGLLLATKINGFFLPIPLVLWAHLYARGRYTNNLFAMLTLGPVVFVLAWPWLWPDPAVRLLQYLGFHAQHQLTAVYFLGKTWGYDGPNAPWSYPVTIMAVTLPLTTLLLAGWGTGRTVMALNRRPIGALYLMCALVMLLVASAPSTPKYDGERLFLPVFPFLALLGGSGAVGLIWRVEKRIERQGRGDRVKRKARRWAAGAIGLLVVLEGGVGIWRYHPYLLSYYNPIVGGLSGACSRDGALFETTYWGESLNDEVLRALNDLPQGASIKPLALHAKCLELLQLWGFLDQDLLIDKPKKTKLGGMAVEYYDYHLLQFRQGFFRRPERALAGSGRFKVKSWGWGEGTSQVPMIGLYKTGPEFELFWRGVGQ